MLTYARWYVISQIMGPLALQQLDIRDPYNFKAPILTQWGMIGAMLAINLFLPESPCKIRSKMTFVLGRQTDGE